MELLIFFMNQNLKIWDVQPYHTERDEKARLGENTKGVTKW